MPVKRRATTFFAVEASLDIVLSKVYFVCVCVCVCVFKLLVLLLGTVYYEYNRIRL